ncbi:alcohol dehydrogenase catalytic domain-containing protein [Streptomyces griseus]|uniref:alcohol dehydrogenase catalytic domain-containing protein n=1 Tax=Streptomyces griseus TaxID=1911 RepID=UPI000A684937|nr:alcohol dehydrogenase catalytic domain-containing protein [Streptomyces griseus]
MIKDPTDAVVRVDAVTICGTDLHILKGDVPETRPGTVLGHEAVGQVVETGADVRTVRPGDEVLISCITACGRCRFCKDGAYGQCRGGGGWILGHLIDGTQAEYVRVPHADLSVHRLPGGVEKHDAVLFADIFPTAYEVGVTNGNVRPGDTVAVVGAGPVGLAAILTARLDETIKIIRSTIFGLRSRETAARSGLRARVMRVVGETAPGSGFAPSVRMEGLLDTQVPKDVADHVIAVLGEALSNVARHARAGRTAVALGTDGREVRLAVVDDGVGIPPDGRRSGLRNMAERAEQLGGSLELTTPADGGTSLVWRVPVNEP